MRRADIDIDQFRQSALEHMPEEEDTIMTIAEQLEERGKKKGLEELIINFHSIGLPIETIAEGTKISPEKIKKIIKAAAAKK